MAVCYPADHQNCSAFACKQYKWTSTDLPTRTSGGTLLQSGDNTVDWGDEWGLSFWVKLAVGTRYCDEPVANGGREHSTCEEGGYTGRPDQISCGWSKKMLKSDDTLWDSSCPQIDCTPGKKFFGPEFFELAYGSGINTGEVLNPFLTFTDVRVTCRELDH